MRSKIIKLVILAVLLVAAAFVSNRVVTGVWGPDEEVSTTKSPEGTGSTEVMNTEIKDTLVTAYYYDNYAKGIIEYAAVRFFNVNTKECNYLFFPGDTRVEMSDELFQNISAVSSNVKQKTKLNKIATCFAQDEDRYQYTTAALEDALGVKVDYYEAVSSDNLIPIINLIDPVSFDVPKSMTFKDDSNRTIKLKKGAQYLSGDQVKGMLTRQELYSGEKERLECSKEYVKKYLMGVVALSDREKVGEYYQQYYSLVESNTSFSEMCNYMDFFYQVKTSNIVMTTAPGKSSKDGYVLNYDKLSSLAQEFIAQNEQTNQEETTQEETTQEETVQEATTKEETTQEETAKEATTKEVEKQDKTEEDVTTQDKTEKEESTTEKEKSAKDKKKEKTTKKTDEKDKSDSKKLKVEIYNSTTINGLAAKWKDYLSKEGYKISATETERRYHLTNPIIYVSKKGQGEDLLEYFPDAKIEVGTLTKADIRIVLGTKNKKVGK